MMLGFQGSNSSSKVYHCVACSAPFTGLASLLVHQATHAAASVKVPSPPQPNTSPHEALFSSMDSSSEHPNAPQLLPPSPSPSFYICDCGEEFQDFSLMLEHKRSHVARLQLLPPLDNNAAVFQTNETFPTQNESLSPPAAQSGLDLDCPSTSKSPDVELPTLIDDKADVSLGDSDAIETTPSGRCKPPQNDGVESLEDLSNTPEQISDTEDMDFQDESVISSENGENLPRKDSLMKLLASAYMKRYKGPLTQNQNNDTVSSKEDVPFDIIPEEKAKASENSDFSVLHLRRLLTTPSVKTKAPPISKVLEASRKKVVSLTKTFSPVVVLETRQKLKDPSINGTYGRYQCGRCRRVFPNLDKLTEHHFLHKKERIKCCRRCKQLIIGRVPLPDNHLCPQFGAMQLSKSKLPFAHKLVPFHSLSNTRKVFFCPLCKHGYARRWNLKNHKCQGPRAALPQQSNSSIQRMLFMKWNGKNQTAKTYAAVNARSQGSRSVSVDTEAAGCIKEEITSLSVGHSATSQVAWMHSAKSFPPFCSKYSMMEPHKESSLSEISQQGEETRSWDASVDGEDSNEGQWTMPLDDEIEVFNSLEKADNDMEAIKSVSVSNEETLPPGLRYFVRDGVKRYPCNRCQKTYSRPCTLRRHLRLCGFRPRGLGTAAQSGSQGVHSLSVRMFPCSVCGKTFNRKDNMMTHRNKCQLRQATSNVDRNTSQLSASGHATECRTEEDDGNNLSIMSLPSVLPRRVTCECGAGFTSPRLLLEHLQKHAEETYTCPTCGETVDSWAEYEVHLQIHMHPHHQILKGIKPQRAKPLLVRFDQQPSKSVNQHPHEQAVKLSQHPYPIRKKQRIVCTRCCNTFANRCSLKRHISWNRCKGVRAPNPPKAYQCSHCSSGFPNPVSLLFHQRSGACKPAIKPVRCTVCFRWFGTVEGLQKHLLSHNQSGSYRCDVCQGTYPNLKSLKNHRRRIHRIMAGNTQPKTQEQLTTE